MGKLPRPSGKEIVQFLTRRGFTVVRVRGSHHFLESQTHRTSVPVHGNRPLKIGTLRSILRNIQLSLRILSGSGMPNQPRALIAIDHVFGGVTRAVFGICVPLQAEVRQKRFCVGASSNFEPVQSCVISLFVVRVESRKMVELLRRVLPEFERKMSRCRGWTSFSLG